MAFDWSGCPLVSVNPEVVHGTPVFAGTRMPVEDAVEYYYFYREERGMSENDAMREIVKEYPTIPGVDALRAVVAYEAAHNSQLQPN